MNYVLEEIWQGSRQILCLRDTQQGPCLRVIPSAGGMILGYEIFHHGSEREILDTYPLEEIGGPEVSKSFKNVKLSPYAGRIWDGSYSFMGRDYRIARRSVSGEALHGLLYDAPFRELSREAGARSCHLRLVYDYPGTDPGFPFPYSCELGYRLDDQGFLSLETTLSSRSRVPLPVVDGWHPYFWTGYPVDHWDLFIHYEQQIGLGPDLVPDGRILPPSGFQSLETIGSRQLDAVFKLSPDPRGPACILRSPDRDLIIELFPEAPYDYLIVYIPPGRNSIALENLSGAPDAFHNGLGLLTLGPGESRSFRTRIRVRSL